MLAFADGKPVEFKGDPNAVWLETADLGGIGTTCLYRPKPEPRVRPWNCAADVPLSPCYIRDIRSEALSWALIISAGTGAINATGDGGIHSILYNKLGEYRYSTDRKTWHPCAVTEEEEV